MHCSYGAILTHRYALLGYTHARMAHVRYPPGRHACTIAPFGFLYGAFGSKLAGALGEGLGFLYVHHAMSPFSLASSSFRYMCSLRFGGGVEVVDLKVKPAQPGRIAHRA
jgi:hypothetical protein